MKKILILCITAVAILTLNGCCIKHEYAEATCMNPMTCIKCGQTEGESLGHDWIDATCTDAKHCSICGVTDGNSLGHDISMISCTSDSICRRCNATIPALGHDYLDATCTEPAKCSVCGEPKGEALGHTTNIGICERCGMEFFETITGSGDDVVTGIAVGDGIYRIHFIHNGYRNFIVKSYNEKNKTNLLVNEIGNYDGYVLLGTNSTFAFEITADGSWSFTVERLDVINEISFAGIGDYVTGISELPSGTWSFEHDGSSNFIVRLYSLDGCSLLVNEIGAYSGKKIVSIPAGSNAFFEIIADGNWSINNL